MRGLCRRHYPAVKSRGLLGQIGLPPARSKYDIRLKAPDQLQPGICRVIVNGEACLVPAQRRGLCDRHYAAIWQRPDLTLDDFAASPISSGDFRLRRKPPPDCCRVVERDVPCDALPHARGLCKNHYAWLREHDMALFERLVSPVTSKPASGGRFKTSHSEVRDSYHFYWFKQAVSATG
jgi:hypothetical protein